MAEITPEELERERIFSNDKDPIEELNELRRKEAEEAGEESEDLEVDTESSETGEATEATEDDDLDAFDTEDKEEETSKEEESEESKESEESEEETSESDNENTDDDEDKEESEEASIYKFKANGQDFEFTQSEINDQFGTVFGKAMDYTRKMQKIAPYRKMVSALEEEGIDEAQLNLAIDVLKGDKGALQKLIAEKSIDIYDLDTEGESNEYKPTNYGKNQNELDLEEVNRKISGDPEYSQTVDIVGNQWDDDSRKALMDNPEWVSGLHSDVKNGVFAKVAPEAAKMKMLDGGSKPDIEYYLEAGQRMFENSRKETAETQEEDPVEKAAQQFKEDSAAADKKRSASSTRSRGSRKGVVDYLDDNDEKFDEWYTGLMDKY